MSRISAALANCGFGVVNLPQSAKLDFMYLEKNKWINKTGCGDESSLTTTRTGPSFSWNRHEAFILCVSQAIVSRTPHSLRFPPQEAPCISLFVFFFCFSFVFVFFFLKFKTSVLLLYHTTHYAFSTLSCLGPVFCERLHQWRQTSHKPFQINEKKPNNNNNTVSYSCPKDHSHSVRPRQHERT